MNEMRLAMDAPADEVIAQFFPQRKQELQEKLQGLKHNSDLESITDADELFPFVQEILTHAKVDDEILNSSRAFFNTHASDIMLLLGFLSLPYCYAAANGAQVLVQSKRILEQPAERLTETAQFVFEVFAKNAFEASGVGLVSILKVRLMHAATRWYIQQGPWNKEEFGMPVNQEDMAGTNLSFSLMVVRGLRKMGKLIKGDDAESFIQYWNAIGKLLGLREELLPENNKDAHLLEKTIRGRQFKESEAGAKLMKSLLSYYEKAAEGSPLEGKVRSMLEFLLGDRVSKMLGIHLPQTEIQLFKPYTTLLRLQNQLLKKNDSYNAAWMNFKKQSEGLVTDNSFQLP